MTVVIADASPLIALATLGKINILEQVFDEIYIPVAVYDEIRIKNKRHSKELEQFSRNRVKKVQNQLAVQVLRKELGAGETEAIVLAKENKISTILIDEIKGRRIAETQGLLPIGTIGVLLKAKEKGIIKAIKPELNLMIRNRYRISQKLYNEALDIAGEK